MRVRIFGDGSVLRWKIHRPGVDQVREGLVQDKQDIAARDHAVVAGDGLLNRSVDMPLHTLAVGLDWK